MRKKEQNINVQINETKIDDHDAYEVIIKNETIGSIIEKDAQQFDAIWGKDQSSKHFKTLDDAVNNLLMQYNLHQ